MEGWKEYKLGDIVNVNTSQYTPKDNWKTALYLDTGNITENKVEEIYEFDCSSLPSRAKRKVMDGDIIFSTVRPNQKHYGYISNPPSNLLVSTGFSVISVKKTYADSKFIYYWLTRNEIIEYLHNIAEQSVSAYPSIKASDICELKIKLPALDYQSKIASLLSSLDDKIKVNRQINENLEQQAQLIFDYMLADSDWSLTQDLNTLANINPTRRLANGKQAPFVEMANMPTTGSFPTKIEKKAYCGGVKFINGDTIMARITPCLENGKAAFVNFLEDNEVGFGSTEYIVLSPKETISSSFLYFLVRNKEFIDFAVKNMNGSSGRQRVSGKIIGSYQMPILNKNKLNIFIEVADNALSKIRQNSFENINLGNLRDTLLPKLMSGELKI